MKTQNVFDLNVIDPTWQKCIEDSLKKMDFNYIKHLEDNKDWLPGPKKIFNAFSLPVNQVNYVLFGESPYPRERSANGYAFWDEAVHDIWSSTGLSKSVNRATSLRNIIKMLLVAEGLLDPQFTTQHHIANINKENLVKTNAELFENLIDHGFLLLNASLVLQKTQVRKDALSWHPFIKCVLDFIFEKNPKVELILFGNIANTIDKLINHAEIKRLYAEHPYNLSFITNKEVIDFFKPLHLLRKKPM